MLSSPILRVSMPSPSPSLLTPSERLAFNAFLSTAAAAAASVSASAPSDAVAAAAAPGGPMSMPFQGVDTGNPDVALAAEWQMYSQLGLSMSLPQVETSAALTKATKDLIALHPPRPQQQQQQLQQYQQQQQHQMQLHLQHQHQQQQQQQHLQQFHHHHQQQQHGHRPIAPAPGPSMPYGHLAGPRSSSAHSTAATTPSPSSHIRVDNSPSPAKRARTSPPTPGGPPHTNMHDAPHLSPSPPPAPTKSTLLSAQQKKANHIQSEQKRRANIRRGYEALCETVPALREAIRAEEEGSANGSTSGNRSGGSATGRRKRGRGEDGEKVDGRAGPRSESVVLQKTIEHIQGLLNEKAALLSRLNHSRSMLGPGHPLLYSHVYSPGKAPWEREWDGGKGLMTDVDGDHESDDD